MQARRIVKDAKVICFHVKNAKQTGSYKPYKE